MVNRSMPVSIAMTSSQMSPSSISSRASCITATAYQSRPDLDRLVYVANRLGVASVVVDRWSYIRIFKYCSGDFWMCLCYFYYKRNRCICKIHGCHRYNSSKSLLYIFLLFPDTAVFFKLEHTSETPRRLIKMDCWAPEFLIQ